MYSVLEMAPKNKYWLSIVMSDVKDKWWFPEVCVLLGFTFYCFVLQEGIARCLHTFPSCLGSYLGGYLILWANILWVLCNFCWLQIPKYIWVLTMKVLETIMVHCFVRKTGLSKKWIFNQRICKQSALVPYKGSEKGDT